MLNRIFLCLLLCHVGNMSVNANELTKEHQQWLKNKFSAQHEKLIPVVAVADMFMACNKDKSTDPGNYQFNHLVTKMDKNVLADKLRHCLGGELPSSDTAINYGLIGCFDEQLKHLPKAERAIKQKLVKQAITKLSKSERQQSFTQCVTDQAIGYLK